MAVCAMGNTQRRSGPECSTSSESTSSLEPESLAVVSPSRSPDTTTLEDVQGVSVQPHLEITEDVNDQYRFRYRTEMVVPYSTIQGVTFNKITGKKTYPTVKLCNFKPIMLDKNPIIRCSLHTVEDEHGVSCLHTHKLSRKLVDGHGRVSSTDEDDPHDLEVDGPNYSAVFGGMTVLFTKKEDQLQYLVKKKILHEKRRFIKPEMCQTTPVEQLIQEAKRELSTMNLNKVRLKFEAFHVNRKGVYMPLCPPVFSVPIRNLKHPQTNELKICRSDKVAGSCAGKEEVFIFVEKVNKKDIMIRFYEEDENNYVVWSELAEFRPEDVHHQYGIVFKTPPYRNQSITENVLVYFYLERPSDGAFSVSRAFEYIPNPNNMIELNRKRRRLDDFASSNTQNIKINIVPNRPTPPLTPLDLSDLNLNDYNDSINENLFADLLKDIAIDPVITDVSMGDATLFPLENEEELGSFPSGNSDMITQFLQNGSLKEWAAVNGVEEFGGMLSTALSNSNWQYEQAFHEGMETASPQMEEPRYAPQMSAPRIKSLDVFRDLCSKDTRTEQTTLSREEAVSLDTNWEVDGVLDKTAYYRLPVTNEVPARATHQMFVKDTGSSPSLKHKTTDASRNVIRAQAEMFVGPEPSSMAVSAQEQAPLSGEGRGSENVVSALIPDTKLLVRGDSDNGMGWSRRDVNQYVYFNEFKEKPNHSRAEAGCEMPSQRLKQKLTRDSKIVQPQMGRRVFEMIKKSVKLNEDNIVSVTENTLDILLKLHKDNKMTNDHMEVCILNLFSYVVGTHKDTVLHVLAAQDSAPPQTGKFLEALKRYNLINTVVNCENNQQETPLLVAVTRGSPQMVTLLLDAGADVNVTDSQRNCVFHLMAMREGSSLNMMTALLQKSPICDNYNLDGFSVLHLCVIRRRLDILSSLLIKSEFHNPNPELLNMVDRKQGNTALHFAVHYRFSDIITYLLSFEETDVNILNYAGKTALDFVREETDVTAVNIQQLLLTHISATVKDEDLEGDLHKKEEFDDTKKEEIDETKKEEIDDTKKEEIDTKDEESSNDDDDKDDIFKDAEDENDSKYAREWVNDRLLDKETVAKICPILDNNGWDQLARKLKYKTNEVKYCEKYWSPSLMVLKLTEIYETKVTAKVIRDHLLDIGLTDCVDHISTMMRNRSEQSVFKEFL